MWEKCIFAGRFDFPFFSRLHRMRLRLNRMALIRSYFKTRAAIRLSLCKNRLLKMIVVHIFFPFPRNPHTSQFRRYGKKKGRVIAASRNGGRGDLFSFFLVGRLPTEKRERKLKNWGTDYLY